MKMLIAVFRPERLDAVREALAEIDCTGMMIEEIRGHGRQKGIELEWRVGTYRVDLLPKVQLTTVVEDHEVNTVIDAIVASASTGAVGDGKVFVLPVEDVIRIRTGERGAIAV